MVIIINTVFWLHPFLLEGPGSVCPSTLHPARQIVDCMWCHGSLHPEGTSQYFVLSLISVLLSVIIRPPSWLVFPSFALIFCTLACSQLRSLHDYLLSDPYTRSPAFALCFLPGCHASHCSPNPPGSLDLLFTCLSLQTAPISFGREITTHS